MNNTITNLHGSLAYPDKSGAVFSPCRRYRYKLWRNFGYSPPEEPNPLILIMLNPSYADEKRDDPTIRRCIGFAKDNGFTGIEIYNLYAYITPSPDILFSVISLNPGLPEDFNIGPENDNVLNSFQGFGKSLVCAWGRNAKAARVHAFWELFLYEPTLCFGENKDGSPKHPLYLPKDTKIRPYIPTARLRIWEGHE